MKKAKSKSPVKATKPKGVAAKPAKKSADAAIHARMRAIVLSLPETSVEIKWGHPHYCVAGKIFTGCGEHRGVLTIGFKMAMEDAAEIVKDKRFWPAPYVGKHGWVATDARKIEDWTMVRSLVTDSYRLIAPKKLLAARKLLLDR